MTVDEVVARLEAIGAALPERDGVACFNRMYLTVTRLVAQRIAGGYFNDAAETAALDVVFAGLYLRAVDAPAGAVPKSWRPLFARRGDTRIEPIQFAVAGMNAHINHDLPVAVVAACERLGIAPDGLHDDFLRINELLAEIDEEVRRSYLSGLALDVDREVSPVLDLVSTWSIERARDAAWVNAEVLWRLRDIGFVRDRFAETLANTVGLATATLLAPVA